MNELTRRDEAFWRQLRAATPARIGLSRTGTALATSDLLAFQRAHAEARDAVHDGLDSEALAEQLKHHALDIVQLHSAAPDRATYLARPDLGRQLDEASRAQLAILPPGHDLAFVVADGLSARAVAHHAEPVLALTLAELRHRGLRIGPIAIVRQGRVAIGDAFGFALQAKLVAVLIGERPGLSAPDSLGIYLTWAPAPGRNDAERNCLSNIRPEGMGYAEAAQRLSGLVSAALDRQLTGIALKDTLETDDPPLKITGAGEGT
ncbi:MAG TPA: ethanolamine ammonia-lyase subunit EutC [Stellaceae bacterium]|nr:ethanolamine ammonia-lyase subunit EutC [Stellaceae bacterium]